MKAVVAADGPPLGDHCHECGAPALVVLMAQHRELALCQQHVMDTVDMLTHGSAAVIRSVGDTFSRSIHNAKDHD